MVSLDFLDERGRKVVRKGGAVRLSGVWTRPISREPECFRHTGTDAAAGGALREKGGARAPFRMRLVEHFLLDRHCMT